MHQEALLPTADERAELWSELIALVEAYIVEVETLPVAPPLDQNAMRRILQSFSFDEPGGRVDVLRRFTGEMTANQVHTPHPCYFGLFNPAPAFMGVMGDAVAAALNPQLAAWSHSPLAVETERYLVHAFAERFGLGRGADGVFTSGGAEANQTALVCALHHRWPAMAKEGISAAPRHPVFYASAESHHSFLKAARVAGLGERALRTVPVNADLRMDTSALRAMLQEDREAGREPFLLVATAGTTGAGVIDPLAELATIAQEQGLWLHVDAAWGGAAMLVPELRAHFDGIQQAGSITFDPHKYLSVPMGAGMFLTRHASILSDVFAVHTAYMPREAQRLAIVDPYEHSLQWSRRFAGLKLFLSLATAGWQGYEGVLRHQARMGDLLRERLEQEGWRIVNRTPLPLVCFTPADEHWDMAAHQRAADAVTASGRAWISTILLKDEIPALRACITNYRTEPRHIEILIETLRQARDSKASAESVTRRN